LGCIHHGAQSRPAAMAMEPPKRASCNYGSAA
jgi:hypothetical protein